MPSVVIKMVVQEDESELADRLREVHLHAPSLWEYEGISAIRRKKVFATGVEVTALWQVVGIRNRAHNLLETVLLCLADVRDRLQQGARVRVPRVVEQGPDRGVLHDFAQIHDDHVVRYLGNHAHVVGNEDDACAGGALQ